MPATSVGTTYARWKATSAVFHRGYWLVASLYLVVDAELSAFQLVFIGTAQGVISLISEVPAGVMADTISRKWSLVVAQLLMGGAMTITGFVTAFPALVVTQMAWGVAWTLISGADVAWISDELDQPDHIGPLLAASARWEAVGAAFGLVGFGAAAWMVDRGAAIALSGLATVGLGLWVAVRFPERNFSPAPTARWTASAVILRRGIALSRRDRAVLLVLTATFLVNGAGEAFGRLYTKQLIALGFPQRPDPMVWYTALGLAVLLLGAVALRLVEARIEGPGATRRTYAAACAVGALGVGVLALAPDALTATVGILLFGGLSAIVTRVVGTIWVNRRTTSDVRATVHSFLAQAEYGGEIICGLGLALLARSTTISTALLGSAVLMTIAAVLVARMPLHASNRPQGHPPPDSPATAR